jgi:undecaprenyl-diphosphatase
MINHLAVLFLLSIQTALSATSDTIFRALNGLAGRSLAFDKLIALSLDNNLVKAAVIGCCFFAAWQAAGTPEQTQRVRKILLTTLVAAALVVATTKALSHMIFLPRPVVLTHRIYGLSGNKLIEYNRQSVRVPLDEESQQDYHKLVTGDVRTNDLGSFPSDHAGFFAAIALGIWLASRRIGAIALAWTLLVIAAAKMISGQHSPLDIAAGVAAAITWLLICQFIAKKWPGRVLEKISRWTLKHNALSSAVLFAIVFEISSTLDDVKPLAKLAVEVAKKTLGAGN